MAVETKRMHTSVCARLFRKRALRVVIEGVGGGIPVVLFWCYLAKGGLTLTPSREV